MSSFNKVILMGNLTRDPEMRVTPGGLAICKFTVAVNRKFKMQSGEEREEVAFIDVDTFGKQAETISKFFSKGKGILVEGRLKQDKWEDKNTKEKRSKLVVVMESFGFVGGGRGDGPGGDSPGGEESSGGGYDDSAPPARPPPRSAPSSTPPAKRPPPPGDHIDEDVPF
ncbi:MAG TPA: single-stranded DNA-binding protein [Opitutales bacterium]|nr:single-stranded DNA-binding protein [Opitutales bacterium]